jgi:hypothetical protein
MYINKLNVTLSTMKKTGIAIILCLIGSSLFSQTSTIENTRVMFSISTDTMYVKYDLTGKHEAFITLEVKDQNNRIIQLKHLSGDIGKGIKPGKDRTIIWGMKADGLDLSGSSLKVKVKGSVFVPVPVAEKKIRYGPMGWSEGGSFFSGYGIFTGDLTKTYRNTIPFGCDLDIYYYRLALYMRVYIGISKTTRDLPYPGGTWPKGSEAHVFIPEASLGYILAYNKLIVLAPFAGIASTDIGPPGSEMDKVPGLKQVKLGPTLTYSLGLNLDFKLGYSNTPYKVSAGLEKAYFFIRLRYSYDIMGFDNKYPGYGGNMHSITIEIGGALGRMLRKGQ